MHVSIVCLESTPDTETAETSTSTRLHVPLRSTGTDGPSPGLQTIRTEAGQPKAKNHVGLMYFSSSVCCLCAYFILLFVCFV